jgi:hypothetical protein
MLRFRCLLTLSQDVMRTLKLLTVSLSACLVYVSAAHAQACLGLPSFASGSVHLNLAAEFPDSAKAYAIGIGAGRERSLFANLGGSQVTLEGFDNKATSGFLEFGFQIPVARAQLCPIAGGSFGVGPDEAGLKVTSNGASGGIALGLPLGTSKLRVIPNAALRYEYFSQKVEESGIGSSKETFNNGIVDVGLGFVFADRFSIQPLAHFTVSGDESDPSFGVFASFSFGWKAR